MKRKIKTSVSFLLLTISMIVFIVSQLPSQTIPELSSSSAQKLVNVKYDPKKYPENVIAGKNKVSLSNSDKKMIKKFKDSRNSNGIYIYSPLDKLGRTQTATAIITNYSMLQHSSKVQARPAFPESTKVSGEFKDGKFVNGRWYGTKSNNRIVQLNNYRGYIYNKSHLIAWSLGGSMNTDNVILGTRAQNVGGNNSKNPGGMAYVETKVRNWLRDHSDDAVFYKATPIYKNNELVPKGVLVTAVSLKDSSFSLKVWTFNAQEGVKINYRNGENIIE